MLQAEIEVTTSVFVFIPSLKLPITQDLLSKEQKIVLNQHVKLQSLNEEHLVAIN